MKNVDFMAKFTEAMNELAAENHTESIEMLTDLLAQDADNKMVLSARGAALLRSKRFDESVADFSKVIDMDPGYARAYHLRGLAREHRGDGVGALADFNKAIELDPHYGAAYYSRASLHAKEGHAEAASEDFATITAITTI